MLIKALFSKQKVKPKLLEVGAGHSRKEWFGYTVVKLDWNEDCHPDVVWDLNTLPYPFENEEFDRIEAHQVLEHVSTQGDSNHLFSEFNEYHRILKPGGVLNADVPAWNDIWAWGDPSHTRVINEGTVSFLDQEAYKECATSPRTDFRYIYKGNFEVTRSEIIGVNYYFELKKKPAIVRRSS